MTPSEVWLPIPELDGYEVSNLGQVRSTDRIIERRRYGRVVMVRRKGVPLKTKVHSATGYVGVELAGMDYLVHRLVLSAFSGPCPAGHEGAHGDGVRTNNHLPNLRYATPVENAADRARHGTAVRGSRVHCAKLTEADVLEIRASTATGGAEAAKRGVSRALVNMVRRREIWAHV